MCVFIKEMDDKKELTYNIDRPLWQKWIVYKTKKLFNLATIKRIDNRNSLYIIPKVNNRVVIKIAKDNNGNIIFSSKLKTKYNNNCNVNSNSNSYGSNNIMHYMLYDILKYIIARKNEISEMQNIYVLVNEYKMINLDIIRYLLDNFKSVTIVTNKIKKFVKLSNDFYDKEGILFAVTNNRRKGLKNSKYIINLDFTNNDIKNYKVNRDAIIINLKKNEFNMSEFKYFEGLMINDIRLDFVKFKKIIKEEGSKYLYLYNDFDLLDVFFNCETYGLNYIKVIKILNNREVNVDSLIGLNGEINEKEL